MKNIKYIIPDEFDQSELVTKLIKLAKTKEYNFIQFEHNGYSDHFEVIAYSKNPITKSQVKKEFESNFNLLA